MRVRFVCSTSTVTGRCCSFSMRSCCLMCSETPVPVVFTYSCNLNIVISNTEIKTVLNLRFPLCSCCNIKSSDMQGIISRTCRNEILRISKAKQFSIIDIIHQIVIKRIVNFFKPNFHFHIRLDIEESLTDVN